MFRAHVAFLTALAPRLLLLPSVLRGLSALLDEVQEHAKLRALQPHDADLTSMVDPCRLELLLLPANASGNVDQTASILLVCITLAGQGDMRNGSRVEHSSSSGCESAKKIWGRLMNQRQGTVTGMPASCWRSVHHITSGLKACSRFTNYFCKFGIAQNCSIATGYGIHGACWS